MFSTSQRRLLTASMIAILIGIAVSPALAAGPTIFINEIHYDNTGTDTGEAIEIAGPAGTDLTGWSIVLYNGNGGASYGTTPLSGVFSDQQGGYGTLSFAIAGIQNGAPDGLALVDASSTVVQFLSYEGAFTAVGGPADGMLSTDIGVFENGSGAVGNSLQLSGTGTGYDDFTWNGEAANTFDAVNTGQTFSDEPAPDPVLVINEIDYDQPGTDFAEFVEIKNVGTVSADLSAFTLELVNGNGGGAVVYQSFTLPAVTLAVGDYFVVCGDAANVANCDLDVTPDSNLVQNGAPDGAGLLYNGTLVDAVSYEGNTGAPYTEGSGVGLEDPGTAGSDNLGISRFPDGTDTDVNNVDFSLHCSTPGQANSAETSNCVLPNTDLVINEIDYDQPGTDAAEFVEIRNNGNTAADLTGWTLEFINGNGTAAYDTINLPAVSLASGDYFVVCANAATVANCDLDDAPDTNFIQNGAPDAVALSFNGTLIDAVSYEGDTGAPYTEGSGAGLEDAGVDGSISRCPDGADTNQNNVDLVFTGTITPGAENSCGGGGPVALELKIHEVQGNGSASPYSGVLVAVEGIVVADFQDGASGTNGDLNGFHVQEEDGDADADPLTSEGIFVFDGSSPAVNVNIGDLVRVEGTVSEYNGLTEISSFTGVSVISTGNPLPNVTPLSLPVTSVDDFEAYEGMYVTFPQALVISEYYNFDRFGEIVLTSERHLTPTAEVEPGAPAIAAASAFLLDKITLDDGRSSQNPDPAIHPNGGVFDLTNLFRGGDTVANVTGVMDYSFGLYRIQPTQGADYTSVNPRTAAPTPVGGTLKVASFNVLNYFTTLDDGVNDICGPALNQECRGADNATEFTRQRDKIIAALTVIDADVVGLLEIENNVNDDALIDLVDGLNSVNGAGTYAYVNTGTIGTDAIKVALIYKPASVTPAGAYAILDSSVDPNFVDTRNRPTLAQTFDVNATGARFTVAVNHFKSKSGSELGPPSGICVDADPTNDVPDCDQGDGQGYFNVVRTAAAEALVNWLAGDPTLSGDEDFLIIGDLNSYDKEDPIDALLAGGYTDLNYYFQGEDAYSYVFDGQIGYLDYGLASAGLLGEVTGTTAWHINADEADLIDYDTSFKQPAQDAIYAPDPYRASDHDPIVVGLDLNAPPVCTYAAPSVETLWPVSHLFVPIDILGIFDPNGDPWVLTITSIFQDELVIGTGSGRTAPDGMGVGTSSAQVRAERDGNGDGRVYHIAFTVDDGRGGTCSGEVKVKVPTSQNPKVKTYDGGALYDSTEE